ncbi:AAA family ATPase [Mycobacterium intracellulare]|uniref:AAA family ATPase n=1 Tax=Mycobacterium intracellulare TaxID=1767 RepID=UPI00044CCF20|nr:AAA family ATPase [Mycobacterium intracellulare]ETZ36120.1 AAA domain protein [Mycobacterium intracellulare MIN_061107_1834]MCA2273955.1 AAA family ATPase [Mycobacterium intracellulare]MCA2324676.1 AAA family ATPase [Mycobacterium intracellulare]UEB22624.1 AAA family ATPase [Mycobacterium intracellulare]WVL05605.1 AAA family ATPase [Mycobacterium intracellulare]
MSDDAVGGSEASRDDDPRVMLARFANQHDEWVRLIARDVLDTGEALDAGRIDYVYRLFRQEKALDARTEPAIPPLTLGFSDAETAEPLIVDKLFDVTGVNALIAGAVIEPHEALTILFGENGTGKTGYSRIFKALAASRTADDVILGDIDDPTTQSQSATVNYRLGDHIGSITWTGERGIPPFTRMSIFDSPCVNFHVDDDLEYTYVPAALALFNHVITGMKDIQGRIDEAISQLRSGAQTLRDRFPRDSSVYPLIETLGAATDLAALRAMADADPNVEERIDVLRQAVAALEANTIRAQITATAHWVRVLAEAKVAASALTAFDADNYNELLQQRTRLRSDYQLFRDELFSAADLPAAPDDTWQGFIAAGEIYREHLIEVGAHDPDHCLYCRQPLAEAALSLVARYSDYLADKISADISVTNQGIAAATTGLRGAATADVESLLAEHADSEATRPAFYTAISEAHAVLTGLQQSINAAEPVALDTEHLTRLVTAIDEADVEAQQRLASLKTQAEDRVTALSEKKKERDELVASAELARSWPTIEQQVNAAKEADRLAILVKAIPTLSRNLTSLAKTASDQLINQNFEALFQEECRALRAPLLRVDFIGRQGKAQRRKIIGGKIKPSKVLSEGEQKVLAMADFLAEARLTGITAPVVFDDPVSSLDHRRIREVAERIARLADEHQVIVFTHDILLATNLLALFEKSKRCTYFQVTDEVGKGEITHASGPRWDTVKSLTKRINDTIAAAQKESGEARSALVWTGYDWIRSWCEVFTEQDLLQGVTQRYQPNVRMTTLTHIKTQALPAAIETVTRVFDDACRFIDGHSQPLATQYVNPTLNGLEQRWNELQDARRAYLESSPSD